MYFDEQSNILIQEIKERIEKLRILGIEELYIKSLFDRKPKLSRMVITKDYKIMLPDYNKEIVMHPLPKAVYFMFLNHPQGIIFKHLPDYKDELHNIYKKITARNEIDDVIASINSITDPTNNAINEKCSRIREAFIKEFDSRIAEQYFITGKRGEPKKVLLEQSLISYETHN